MRSVVSLTVAALAVAGAALSAFAGAFTPGSLIVMRYGNGSGPATTGDTALPIFLDEYSVTGTPTLLQSIALPTSGANAVTAVNTTNRDGIIQRSQDGRYVVLGGYRADAGTVGVVGTAAKVAVRVGQDGVADTSTSYSNTSVGSPIRSVASFDGSGFYAAHDGSNSVSYIPFGGNSANAIAAGSYRAVHVANNQLYGVSGSAGSRGVSAIGPRLPTAGIQTPFNITNNAAGTGAGVSSMVFGASNVIYAAGCAIVGGDDFRRYVDTGSGFFNATPAATSVIASPEGASSAYGVWSVPDGTGGFTVFLSTNKSIYRVDDANPLSSNFGSLTLTKIIDAPTNTVFRGIAGSAVPTPATMSLLGLSALIAGRRRT